MSDLGANNCQGPCREGEEPKPTMNGRGKSDPAIVAVKLANNAGKPVAEPMEPRVGAKGNADRQTTCRAQNRESVSHALERIREVARHKKKEKFTSLLHHVTIDLLRAAFVKLKRDAAPGVDGMTWEAYEIDREARLRDLHSRAHGGTYRALPSRRRFIPKADGRQRPLAVAALEDKIVQRALMMVLNAIYEADFLKFSYGFRPKRSQHDTLDALVVGISGKKVNYILDADIRSFFDRRWDRRHK
jgi:RNA-directed DNA polymerase